MAKQKPGRLTVTLQVPCATPEAAAMWANFCLEWFTSVPPIGGGNMDAKYDPHAVCERRPQASRNIEGEMKTLKSVARWTIGYERRKQFRRAAAKCRQFGFARYCPAVSPTCAVSRPLGFLPDPKHDARFAGY